MDDEEYEPEAPYGQGDEEDLEITGVESVIRKSLDRDIHKRA